MVSAGTQDAQSLNAVRVTNWRKRIQDGKPKANPQVVAGGIAEILDNPRPKLRYVFGKDAKIGLMLRRLLPWSVLERLLIKASGLDV
jgi:hypothetical protein